MEPSAKEREDYDEVARGIAGARERDRYTGHERRLCFYMCRHA